MPRFYFNQRIGETLIEDPDGCEFASPAQARSSALVTARHLWASAIIAGDDLSGEAIEIIDSRGDHVATVDLAEALPFRPAAAPPALSKSKAA